MAKETFYFPHDFEPTSDPKIEALLSEYKAEGYGLYWRIIEMLHSNEQHKLPLKKYLFMAIAKQMLANAEQIEAFVRFCIDVAELLKSDGEFIWSDRVNRNIDERKRISLIRSTSGTLGAIAKQNNANAKQLPSKEKKRKEKKVIPSIDGEREIDFEKFWNRYDKKVDRKKSKAAFMKLSENEISKIKLTLRHYIQNTPDAQFRKNPLTYLNGKCWDDEQTIATTKTEPVKTYPGSTMPITFVM